MRFFYGVMVGLLCFSGAAVADGGFFSVVATRKAPSILQQRAIISHQDGVERLLVESAVDAEGEALGWIIPLPAKPSAIEAGSSGTLGTMAHVTRANISSVIEVSQFVAVAFAVGLFCLSLILVRYEKKGYVCGIIFAVVIVGWGLMPALNMASGGGSSGALRSGVSVLEAVEVGSYVVSTLEAESPDALDGWLVENGFNGLGEAGRRIAEDYIEEGWTFGVAVLNRTASGVGTPHPIQFTFPAAEPIYPMRLTALSASPVALRLWVIGDERHVIDGFRVDYCERFKAYKTAAATDIMEGEDMVVPGFRGVRSRRVIAHAGVPSLMWDGCVVTELYREVATSEMQADYVAASEAYTYYLPRYFTKDGAASSALRWASLVFIFGLPVLCRIFYVRTCAPKGRRFMLAAVALPFCIVCVAMVKLGPLLYPTAPFEVKKTQTWKTFSVFGELVGLQFLVERYGPGVFELNDEAFEYWVAELGAIEPNLLTGVNKRMEDSPGNFYLERIVEPDAVLVLTIFDEAGVPQSMRLGKEVLAAKYKKVSKYSKREFPK